MYGSELQRVVELSNIYSHFELMSDGERDNRPIVQWDLSNEDTIGSTTACPDYRGVCISEAPGYFR